MTVDVSTSMRDELSDGRTKLEAAKDASCGFLATKVSQDVGDEVALISFNSDAVVECPMSPIHSGYQSMIGSIRGLRTNGGTEIPNALYVADGIFLWPRRDVVRRVVLLTDGHSSDPRQAARSLKDRGVVIDVVGIGDSPSQVNEELLREVASTIDGQCRYRFLDKAGDLQRHYAILGNKTSIAGY